MKSLYSKIKSCVKTASGLADYFNCNVGTRRGCKCGPILFPSFINDLVGFTTAEGSNGVVVSQDTKELLVLMYADDISNFTDAVTRLQEQTDIIQSTLVISKSKGSSETLRDIRISTYQICKIEENTNRTTKFYK